jgi:hypothetical protein
VVQADLLDRALADSTELEAAQLAYEAASLREIEPWYRAAVLSDRQGRLLAEQERRARRGEDATDLASDPAATAGALIRHGLLPLVRTDADAFRAFLRMFNLLDPPEALMADASLVAKVLQSYQERDSRAPEEPLGPPRREMLRTLGVG